MSSPALRATCWVAGALVAQGLQALSGYPIFVLYGLLAALDLPRGHTWGSAAGALVGALFILSASIVALGAMSLAGRLGGIEFDPADMLSSTYAPAVALAAVAGGVSAALERRQRRERTHTTDATSLPKIAASQAHSN